MLPPDQYRKWTYPPPGRQWVQLGDKQLDAALKSISQEAHEVMQTKREGMKEVHTSYLERNNYIPYSVGIKRIEPPKPAPQQFVIADPDDGYKSAEEGPSKAQRMIDGAKHVTKNYAWPITRDILAPAAADVAVNVGKGAAWLIGKSFWSLADIIWALNGSTGSPPEDGGGDGSYPSIGWGGSSSSSLGNGASSSDDPEVDELSQKGKGYLVEEIYKQPGWANFFGREDSRGYTTDETTMFRKQLGKMSQRDLAKVLINLKHKSRGM